jgi:TRAP-type C4-dicarboxylate transport system permease small subunit
MSDLNITKAADSTKANPVRMTEASGFVTFHKSIHRLSGWFERVGLVAMAAMALTTLIDVIGSKFFHLPLPGSTEIIGVIQVIAIAGGMAFSKIDGRQIRVDFIMDVLPRRGKAALEVFSAILGLGLFVVVCWMTYEQGISFLNSGTKTFLLGIPLPPFIFWIALCCVPMCFVILIDLIISIERIFR